MRVLDTPIAPARGRTLRELVIIGGGTAALVQGALAGSATGNLVVYALMTVAFATRFFAARIMMGGLFVGALALHLPWLLYPDFGVTDLAPVVWVLAAGLVLISSRDLIERFDNNESGGLPGFPNFWLAISRSHRRAFCWCAYSLGALGGMLYHLHLGAPAGAATAWPLWALAGAVGCTLLIVAGRSLAFVATAAYSAWVLAMLVPYIGDASKATQGEWIHDMPAIYQYTPHYVLPAAIAAAAALAIATPYALRWLGLVVPTLFGRGRRQLAD